MTWILNNKQTWLARDVCIKHFIFIVVYFSGFRKWHCGGGGCMSKSFRESAYANLCFGLEIDNKLILYTQTKRMEKRMCQNFISFISNRAQKKFSLTNHPKKSFDIDIKSSSNLHRNIENLLDICIVQHTE